jgi:hypothetical protein
MTVRMIVVVMLVSVDPIGAGVGLVIGMSPAKAEAEKTHINAIANRKRFIDLLLLIWGMQKLGLQMRIQQYPEIIARFERCN